MNLFTRNSPYYHLLKYLLFLLKHPVYRRLASPYSSRTCRCTCNLVRRDFFLSVWVFKWWQIQLPSGTAFCFIQKINSCILINIKVNSSVLRFYSDSTNSVSAILLARNSFSVQCSVEFCVLNMHGSYKIICWLTTCGGPGSVVGIATELRAGRPGDRIPVKARFSAPVPTGPGAHPPSCTMGTGSFPGVKSGRGVTLTPHPLLVPWSWKSRAIASTPPMGRTACTEPQCLYKGCTVSLPLTTCE